MTAGAARFDVAKGTLELSAGAQRYEYGTQNDALFYALGAALDFVQSIAWTESGAQPRDGGAVLPGLLDMAGVDVLSRRRRPTGRR